MIDAHCHLQFHSFENDFDEIAKRAFDAGVTRIVNVGTKLDSSYKAVDFANAYKEMYAVVGIHPHHADKIENDNWLIELEELGKHEKVIAIGEIGLDYFSYKSNGIVDPIVQKSVFEKQIELAYKVGLPLQIHNRQAGEDIVKILRHHRKSLQEFPGMFHCFAGDMEILKDALEMGFFIGLDGNVTYKGLAPGETTNLKDIAKYIPFDRLIVETDSPFLAPVPYRGTRNEPANIIITGKFLAELKNISFESLLAQSTKNVYTLFKKLK
jgi:TatD DNase family protein